MWNEQSNRVVNRNQRRSSMSITSVAGLFVLDRLDRVLCYLCHVFLSVETCEPPSKNRQKHTLSPET